MEVTSTDEINTTGNVCSLKLARFPLACSVGAFLNLNIYKKTATRVRLKQGIKSTKEKKTKSEIGGRLININYNAAKIFCMK